MPRGDHVYVYRFLYSHHGIDCGDGTVIHFSGEPGLRFKKSKAEAAITRSSMDEFLKGGKLRIRDYGFRDDAETTVARAESELGSKAYDLGKNNCEHFAAWCCTGKRASEQVRGGFAVAGQGATLVASLVGTARAVSVLGSVSGVSGAGVMSALASAGRLVGGGAARGPMALSLVPTAVSVALMRRVLRDDEHLSEDERASRHAARVAAQAAGPTAVVAGTAAIFVAGTTGLSAPGIVSGLAALGGVLGGGAVAGTTIVVAAPAVAVAGVGTVTYVGWRTVKKRRKSAALPPEGDDSAEDRQTE